MEIMMSTPLVPMVLDGTKTQTRRTGKRWLKVKPGDVLAMREAFALNPMPMHPVFYRADHGPFTGGFAWTPAVHMPLHLVRVHLHVTRVWFERADAISEEDAIAEGMANLTVEGLLELAGGSKRLIINLLERTYRKRRMSQRYTRELWDYLAQVRWPAMTACERFLLVIEVLGGSPLEPLTCIEFKAVRV